MSHAGPYSPPSPTLLERIKQLPKVLEGVFESPQTFATALHDVQTVARQCLALAHDTQRCQDAWQTAHAALREALLPLNMHAFKPMTGQDRQQWLVLTGRVNLLLANDYTAAGAPLDSTFTTSCGIMDTSTPSDNPQGERHG